MKLEIEITEEELRSAIERKVRTAVADQTNSYGTDAYIKEQVKAHWKAAVDTLVEDALKNSTALREKIALPQMGTDPECQWKPRKATDNAEVTRPAAPFAAGPATEGSEG